MIWNASSYKTGNYILKEAIINTGEEDLVMLTIVVKK